MMFVSCIFYDLILQEQSFQNLLMLMLCYLHCQELEYTMDLDTGINTDMGTVLDMEAMAMAMVMDSDMYMGLDMDMGLDTDTVTDMVMNIKQ